MKIALNLHAMLVALLLSGTCALAAPAAKPLFLVAHGEVVSSSVRVINGRAYVPLADVAKAYGQTLVKRPNGYELTDGSSVPAPSQAASPPAATSPAAIVPAGWALSVTGVDQVLTYSLRNDPRGTAVAPVHADDGLIVVNCRVTNGSASARTLGLSTYFTSLTDDQGNTHKPIAFDANPVKTVGAQRGVTVPANGTATIAVVFSISQEAGPKTFNFALMSLTEAGLDTAHRTNVHLPLQ